MENTKRMLTRREFLAVSGSAAAAAILASCAPAPAPVPTQPPPPAAATSAPAATKPPAAPPTKAPTTIEFLAWGDTTDGPAWEKLAPAYQAKYPGQVVKVTPVADPNNNFYTKLQTMFAGGTPPNLASFQGWEWQVYADKNLLAPIDDYITRDKLTGPYPAGFTSVDQSVRRKGKAYLIPLQMASMLMFYSKKMFDDAGVKYPTDDWTFEQFYELAQKLTTTSGTAKKYGLQGNGNWYRDIGWIVLTGKREFDNVIDPKKAQFSNADVMAMIQKMTYDAVHTDKVAPNPTDTSGAYSFNNVNCAMRYDGPWYMPQINSPTLREQKKQVEFDVVRMPKGAGSGRPHRGWAEGVAIPKTDKVDAAWDFAAYMAGEGNQTYSEITGRTPNNLALAESWWVPRAKELYGVNNAKAFLDAFKEGQIDVVSGVPRSKMWAEVVKPTAWDALNNGSAKAAQVLPQVDQKLQAMLDEYWKNNP